MSTMLTGRRGLGVDLWWMCRATLRSDERVVVEYVRWAVAQEQIEPLLSLLFTVYSLRNHVRSWLKAARNQ
jgi:hypothetical protein